MTATVLSNVALEKKKIDVVKELDSDEVTFHEIPMTSQGEAQPGYVQPKSSCSGE